MNRYKIGKILKLKFRGEKKLSDFKIIEKEAKLVIGDIFWNPFMGEYVEKLEDIDYGDFHPNKLGSLKLKL